MKNFSIPLTIVSLLALATAFVTHGQIAPQTPPAPSASEQPPPDSPTPAVPAAAPAPTVLRSIEVTAKRTPEPAPPFSVPANLPASTASVGAAQLATTVNLATPEDVFQYFPSISARERYIGDTAAPLATRTSTALGARSLVYVDSLLISNLLGNDNTYYTPAWGIVTPGEIERVDFIYGPFSALYPGNSMGGVAIITTRMPDQFEAHLSAQVFSQSADVFDTRQTFNGSDFSASIGDRQGRLAYWVSFNHLDNDSQPITFATAAPSTSTATPVGTLTGGVVGESNLGANRIILGGTGMNDTLQDTATVKLAYDFSSTLRATYSLGLWHDDTTTGYQSYLRDASGNTVSDANGLYLINGVPYQLSDTNFLDQQQEFVHLLNGLTLQGTPGGEWDWEASASAFTYASDLTRVQATDTSADGTLTSFDGTGWQTLDLKADWNPLVADGAHQFTFGAHLDHYQLDLNVQNIADWQTGDSGTPKSSFGGDTATSALYAQDAWSFAPKWKLTLGGRFENWQAYDGSAAGVTSVGTMSDRSENFFSPKLSLSFQPAPLWTIRASFGQAYRMPTVTELYLGTTPSSSSALTYNNPNLKPENVLSGELAVERTLDKGFLRASLFGEDNRNALIAQVVPTVSSTSTFYTNVNEVRTLGVELAGGQSDVFIDGLDITGSTTFADGVTVKDDAVPSDDGKTAVGVPRWRGRLVVSYRQTRRLSYSLGLIYSSREYSTLANTDVNPDTYLGFSSYAVLNAKINYRLTENLTTSLGVDNLTNELYYQYHPYPGRTLIAGLTADF